MVAKDFKFRLKGGKVVKITGHGRDVYEAEDNAIDIALRLYENVESIIYL